VKGYGWSVMVTCVCVCVISYNFFYLAHSQMARNHAARKYLEWKVMMCLYEYLCAIVVYVNFLSNRFLVLLLGTMFMDG
jgi:hypothetical protein